MSYLLIALTLLTFLVLWSNLPEPRSEKTSPETATAVQESMMKMDPDQIGEPDGHGRIKVGVQSWFGPDPAIPGYVPWRVDLDHVGHPARVVMYEPLRAGRER